MTEVPVRRGPEKLRDPLWCVSGPAIPVAARLIPGAATGGPERVWVSVNSFGQRLPQMYKVSELRHLDKPSDAAALGMCPRCYGYGTSAKLSDPFYPTAIDELGKAACPSCGGSGRPAVHVTLERDGSEMVGRLEIVPHFYVAPSAEVKRLSLMPPVTPDMCLACGLAQESADAGHIGKQ